MLKERIRRLAAAGGNCSQILLQAAAEEYGLSLPQELLAACGGIQGGFGINGICSGLVGAVMALGLLCGEEEVRQKRILFLLRAQERFGGLDCCRLSAEGTDCIALLEEIAALLQEVLEET